MHCVPLGIQIVQIVCECELSTVFNFGSPQCLVSASLRRAVPHATVPAKAETAMHFDRTDRWKGEGVGDEDPPLLLCVHTVV